MKAKFLALAALVLGMASCQTDVIDGVQVDKNGEAAVVLEVGLPAETRAAADSGIGAIGNIDLEDEFDIRYILGVYDEKDELAKRIEKTEDESTSTNFELRLVPGRHYRFVVWADFVKEGKTTALHYDASDLKDIKLVNSMSDNLPMDESRDAYTGVYDTKEGGVDNVFSSTSVVKLTLTRPFAKLRVVTTDMKELYSDLVSATIEYNVPLYTSFNALTAEPEDLEYNVVKNVMYDTMYYENEANPRVNGGIQTLYSDYFFGAEDDRVMFTLDVEDQTGLDMPVVEFNTNIPVQRNYLTTVQGPILTDPNNITVTIDNNFAQPNIDVEWKKASTAQELADIFEEVAESTTGEETHIVLNGDINLDDLLNLTRASSSASITIASGKEVVLDIKNYTITGTDNETASFGMFNIQPDAKLTIEGTTGKIQLTAENNRGWNAYSSVVSNQRGEFVLNGGTIEHLGGTDMAYGLDILTNTGAGDAKATINGGGVKSYTYRAVRLFLNSTKATAELVVNGGTIDGSNNKSIWMQNANTSVNPGKLVVAENASLYGDVMVSGAGAPELAIELSVAEAALKNGATVIPSNIPAGYDIYVKNGNWVVEKGVEVNGNEIAVSNAGGLKWIAQQVNSGADYFAGKTVVLTADIDLKGEEWTPIGSAYKDHGFMGNFDGNGKVIKNLKISNITPDADGYVYAGLFGVTEGTETQHNSIKNLTIENVTISTEGHIVAAAIAYPYYTDLENITVKGNVAIKGGNYTSGVLAYTRRCVNAKEIAIKANNGSVIEGNSTVGGVISDIQMNGGLEANYSNFEASGLTIKGITCIGGISGIISKQTLDGAIVKNITIVCDNARKGQIAGSVGEPSVINNVVVENVTGAENLVGATYDSGKSSNLTINGVVYEYLENGLIKQNGDFLVCNNEQLIAALATEGTKKVIVAAGKYNLPSALNNNQTEATLTIVGAGIDNTTVNGAVNTNSNNPGNYANGLDLVFENLTFETANNGYNGGFGHAKSVTFRNCKIVGQFYAHSGAPHYFYDCTIDPLTGYLYTYSSDCVFERCTFSASEGKALQIYADASTGEHTVTITDCEFVAAKQAQTWDGKPVTGIDINSNGAKFAVAINGCTATGFPAGLNSKSTLWNVKDGGKAHATVTVDGLKVWDAGYEYLADGILSKDGEYLILNKTGLFSFANEVNVNKNAFTGKTVKLTADIDLNNEAWAPVGQTGATTFNGVFDGQDKTIYNLNVNSEAQVGKHYSSGLFGWVESHTAGHGHIKNVKINGATIVGHHNCGALVGYITQETALVENCHVTGAVVTCTKANNDADGDKAGALIGNATVATPVKNCTATNSTVSAGRDAGQVIGAGKQANVTGCSATDVTVSANGTGTGANVRNEVIGRLL